MFLSSKQNAFLDVTHFIFQLMKSSGFLHFQRNILYLIMIILLSIYNPLIMLCLFNREHPQILVNFNNIINSFFEVFTYILSISMLNSPFNSLQPPLLISLPSFMHLYVCVYFIFSIECC